MPLAQTPADVEYVELSASVASHDADAASSILRTLADGSAWIETPFTQPDIESGAVARNGARSRVHVYMRGADAEANASLARMALAAAGIDASVTTRGVAEADWAHSWKEHFHVERFGERIVVVPSWRSYEAAPGDVVLTLDPGMAFGTGQHETTRMCLEALERSVRPGMRVLDVGCGSGILSLAAAKLGAREVAALDVDDVCVRVTRENAIANGVDGIVRVARGSAGDRWPFDEPPSGAFDIVVANIVAGVIVELAPALVDALAPSGRLMVSGVIEEREAEVRTAIDAAGGRVASVRAMADWRCIEALRS